jgi:hypothetical protein
MTKGSLVALGVVVLVACSSGAGSGTSTSGPSFKPAPIEPGPPGGPTPPSDNDVPSEPGPPSSGGPPGGGQGGGGGGGGGGLTCLGVCQNLVQSCQFEVDCTSECKGNESQAYLQCVQAAGCNLDVIEACEDSGGTGGAPGTGGGGGGNLDCFNVCQGLDARLGCLQGSSCIDYCEQFSPDQSELQCVQSAQTCSSAFSCLQVG